MVLNGASLTEDTIHCRIRSGCRWRRGKK